jgi:tight adherence protein B
VSWWGPCLLVAGALTVVWRGSPRLPRLPVASLVAQLLAAAARRPRHAALAAVCGASTLGLVAGGPVSAVVTGVYTGLGGRALIRRSARRRAATARVAALDRLVALAADLRAGLPPVAATTTGTDRLERLTVSVWRLAERTGAPAADLVERIEADARAADRAAASAAAQAAGAQATAMLLAVLPLGGIGLGVLIGADPVHVLLRTPLGGACAITALALQCAGLLWAERLVKQ